jgi:endonuclease YncB( thermonuclease family)
MIGRSDLRAVFATRSTMLVNVPRPMLAVPASHPARRIRCAIALALLAWAFASPGQADFSGRVVSVLDGDSIVVRDGTRETHVRLVGIDAPERGQAYGGAARRSLASRVAGRDVRIVARGVDVYGRTLGRVFVNAQDINAAQVESGYAWVFRRSASDAALLALEADAKQRRRGLWRDDAPVAPWVWRERHGDRAPALPSPVLYDESVPTGSAR